MIRKIADSDEEYKKKSPPIIKQIGNKELSLIIPKKKRILSGSLKPELTNSGRLKRKRKNLEVTKIIKTYGWSLEICTILGNNRKKKKILELIHTGLNRGFVNGMANCSQKDGYFLLLFNENRDLRAAGIFHIEYCGKTSTYILISAFATDPKYQKQGLGRLLILFLVENAIKNNLKIIVLARPEAIPFWTHHTLGFRKMIRSEMSRYDRSKDPKLIDLIYDGEIKDLLTYALFRFEPKGP